MVLDQRFSNFLNSDPDKLSFLRMNLTFKLHHRLNVQNHRTSAVQNPHKVYKGKTQYPQSYGMALITPKSVHHCFMPVKKAERWIDMEEI